MAIPEIPPEKPKQTLIAQANEVSGDSIANWLRNHNSPKQKSEQSMSSRPSDSTPKNSQMQTIESSTLGGSLQLPKSWKADKGESPFGGMSHVQEYHLNGDKAVTLGFLNRGQRIDEAAGKSFMAILGKSGHEIVSNGKVVKPAELEAMAPVLDELANGEHFKFSKVQTDHLNGQKVLVAEGKYANSDKHGFYVFYNADDSGSAVRDIYFETASKQAYDKNLPQIHQALKTIRWR